MNILVIGMQRVITDEMAPGFGCEKPATILASKFRLLHRQLP